MNQRESNVDQFDGPIDGKWSILNGRSVAKLKGLRGWTKCDRPCDYQYNGIFTALRKSERCIHI